jgi:hypothetical protein
MATDLEELQRARITTLRGIAAELKRRRIPTAAGRRIWHSAQVARVFERIK